MFGETTVYPSCLGTASYYKQTLNSNAFVYFSVNSIATNNEVPLNLFFDHEFFSSYLTKGQNDKFITDLTTVLNSVNAQNITSYISQNTPVAQSILVSYNIDNVEQTKVDELTTIIANVCNKAMEDISIKSPCSNNNSNDNGNTIVDNEQSACIGNYRDFPCYNGYSCINGKCVISNPIPYKNNLI